MDLLSVNERFGNVYADLEEGVTLSAPPTVIKYAPASFSSSVASIMALCCRFAAAVRSCGGTFRLLQ